MSNAMPLTWDYSDNHGVDQFVGPWILVHPYEGGAVHIGPFATQAEADAFMNAWPDDEDMIDDPYIAPLNHPTTVG